MMGPAPRLIVAMAQHDQGQKKRARKTLAMAILGFDWSAAQADSRGVWIAHILRREAEALILPNLPAFLQGEYQPQDNDERLAFVGICQFQGRCHAAARLYADAFATDPALAEDLTSACRSRAALGDKQPVSRVEDLATECRYPAARCAALAGCGLGEDGAKLSATERSHWRMQARGAAGRPGGVGQYTGQRLPGGPCSGKENVRALAGRPRPGRVTRTERDGQVAHRRTERMPRALASGR